MKPTANGNRLPSNQYRLHLDEGPSVACRLRASARDAVVPSGELSSCWVRPYRRLDFWEHDQRAGRVSGRTEREPDLTPQSSVVPGTH